MQALIVREAGKLELADIPSPRIGAYDALVKIEVCGICNSTDHKLIEGKMFWAPPFPIVLGHESVGTVVEASKKVRKFKVGDRVTRPLAFWPGSGGGLNVAMGGFAEYGIVRDGLAMATDGDRSLAEDYNVQRQLIVPAHLQPAEASLAISLAETASVFRHLPNLRGKSVVIAGTGVVGLAFGLWAKLSGATVVTVGRRAERLKLARQLGADAAISTQDANWLSQIREAAGGPVSGILEATGDAPLAEQLLSVLDPQGFAVAYGVPPTGVSYSSRWQNANVEEHLSFAWVADLMARGWVKPEWFISRVWPLREAVAAFEQVEQGKVIKGFIRMD